MNRTRSISTDRDTDANTPYAATPISVLKALLAQLFSLRVGNMQTYKAVARAYEDCLRCANLPKYEEHLWTALEEAL